MNKKNHKSFICHATADSFITSRHKNIKLIDNSNNRLSKLQVNRRKIGFLADNLETTFHQELPLLSIKL